MTAYEKAVALHPFIDPKDFRRLCEAYHHSGFIFETDSLFGIAKPVNRHASYKDIYHPLVRFPYLTCNCYYIPVLVGTLEDFEKALRPEMPWVCFSRVRQFAKETGTKDDLHFYRLDRITRLIKRTLWE